MRMQLSLIYWGEARVLSDWYGESQLWGWEKGWDLWTLLFFCVTVMLMSLEAKAYLINQINKEAQAVCYVQFLTQSFHCCPRDFHMQGKDHRRLSSCSLFWRKISSFDNDVIWFSPPELYRKLCNLCQRPLISNVRLPPFLMVDG